MVLRSCEPWQVAELELGWNRSRIWPQKSLPTKPVSAAPAPRLQVSSDVRAGNRVGAAQRKKGRSQESVRGRQGLCAAGVQASGCVWRGDLRRRPGSHVQMTGRPADGLEGKGRVERAGVFAGRSGVLRTAGCALGDLLDPGKFDPVCQQLCWPPGRPVCPRYPSTPEPQFS